MNYHDELNAYCEAQYQKGLGTRWGDIVAILTALAAIGLCLIGWIAAFLGE